MRSVHCLARRLPARVEPGQREPLNLVRHLPKHWVAAGRRSPRRRAMPVTEDKQEWRNERGRNGAEIARTLGLRRYLDAQAPLKRWWGWRFFVFALAAGGLWWIGRDSGGEVQYRTQPVEARRHSRSAVHPPPATLQTDQPGRCGQRALWHHQERRCRYNSKVKAGQVLARLGIPPSSKRSA